MMAKDGERKEDHKSPMRISRPPPLTAVQNAATLAFSAVNKISTEKAANIIGDADRHQLKMKIKMTRLYRK